MSPLDIAKLDLLSVAIVLFAGLVGMALAKKLKVPDIVLFLLIGIGIGPAAGLLNVPQNSTMNQFLLTLGASYLLFEGGASLSFSILREVWITLLALATAGVLITGAVTACFGWWLGLPLATAVLLGAVTAATDPAALVPLFQQVPIRDRVAQTVMSESALNDAMGAIVTFAIVGVVGTGQTSGAFDLGASLAALGWEAGIGLGLGAAVGTIAAILLGHPAWGFFRGAGALGLIVAVLLAYLGADAVHASGFMAVFAAGVMVGNRDKLGLTLAPHDHHALEHEAGRTALVMRMFIFVLLGSQVNFGLLAACWWQGLLLLAVFVFLARPAAVFLCAGPDRRARWTLHELIFMSWTRETGVIPAALVGILAGMGVPGMDVVASITFVFILGTILIQAPTTAWLAGRLGLLLPPQD